MTDLHEEVEYLQQARRDLDGMENDRFMAGYDQAIHDLRYLHIRHTATCECDIGPFPEEHRDGHWRCGDCDEHLDTGGDI